MWVHYFLQWYEVDFKWLYYIVTVFGLLFLTVEDIKGYKDLWQKQFNIVCKFFIITTFILFIATLQGILNNAWVCYLILFGSVFAITLSVVYNLKRYDYFND